jgi:ribosomal protein S27AE
LAISRAYALDAPAGSIDDLGMQAVGVELVTQCRACEGSVAVNGIVESAACPRCARTVAVGADLWRGLLAAATVQVATRAVGFEIATTFASGEQHFRGVLRHVATPDGLARRALPAGLETRGAAFVAGEDLEGMRVDGAPSVRTMHCPQCGAPAEIARGGRELACAYCGVTSAILPPRARGRPAAIGPRARRVPREGPMDEDGHRRAAQRAARRAARPRRPGVRGRRAADGPLRGGRRVARLVSRPA